MPHALYIGQEWSRFLISTPLFLFLYLAPSLGTIIVYHKPPKMSSTFFKKFKNFFSYMCSAGPGRPQRVVKPFGVVIQGGNLRHHLEVGNPLFNELVNSASFDHLLQQFDLIINIPKNRSKKAFSFSMTSSVICPFSAQSIAFT